MSVNARLAARAEAHGLERREGTRTVWALPGTGFALVWPTPQGQWTWAPPNKRGRGSNTPHYPTEETALSAALDWLDLQHPDRKLPEPSTGVRLAEVVGLLRHLKAWHEHRVGGSTPEGPQPPGQVVGRVLSALESLALPPASDEGQVLAVAWDYALTKGGLSESGRAALVAAVRHHPDVVEEARLLGPWIPHGSIKDDPEPWTFYRFPAFGLEKALEVRSEYPISNPGEEWVVVIDDERLPGSYETPEEAREAADRTARDRGWWPMAGILQSLGDEEEPAEPLERNQFPEEGPPRRYTICWNCGVSLGLDPGGRCSACGSYLPDWVAP